MRTKDGHSSFLDWMPFGGCLLVAFSPLLAKYCIPEEVAFHQFKTWMSDNAWYVSICGIGTILGVAFWHSFCLFDEKSEELRKIKEAAPRLRITCAPDISGCVVPNQWQGGSNLFFRIAVECEGSVPVVNCRGRLIRITRNGVIRWGGGAALLTFAPSEHDDAQAKTIHPYSSPEYLDVIFFLFGPMLNFLGLMPGTKDRQWLLVPRLNEIFDAPAPYELTVEFLADAMLARQERVIFDFTGDFRTTTMRLVVPPPPTSDMP